MKVSIATGIASPRTIRRPPTTFASDLGGAGKTVLFLADDIAGDFSLYDISEAFYVWEYQPLAAQMV